SYPSRIPNPEREFAITKFNKLDSDSFRHSINQRLAFQGPSKTVFVFVHGYNVPYSQGVYRIGQMVADFEADAVPVHYSWPSDGHQLGYLYDRDSVQFARDGFVQLLDEISTSDAETLFIMGHSMGCLLVMEGLRSLALLGRDDILEMISPIVLASPDIDVDVFNGQLRYLAPRPDPFIVFVASDDGALRLSQRLRGGHARVGEGGNIATLQQQGITVLDLSEVDLGDGSQHTAFASSPTLIQVLQQARTVEGTLASADRSERGSPLEALSELTSGLLYLPIPQPQD
ncbi:MAG: alpha/beta fold hydrolase, partial [Pseudomonadota bacterium]